MPMEWDLPLIWAGIIALAVAMYVILDGFDLGVGILFPFAANESERDQMMASIAPYWDGNETWLVLGGVGLLMAFPLAYSVIMPALYLPIIVMLLALVFRGVAFEFRGLSAGKTRWNFAFAGGSVLAAFCQGLILGGLLQGILVEGNTFAGRTFDFATPFSLLTGVGVACGYALLGATWLVMRSDGAVAERARAHAKLLLLGVLTFMLAVSLWTPLEFPRISQRWFSVPNIFYLAPVPIITALVAFLAWRGLQKGNDYTPFFASIGLFLLGFLGLAISTFPYLIPPTITIWEAAAVPSSLKFSLVGTVILLPIILLYTGFVYWLFRGKTAAGESYH
jgi:cytochrome d ubiquinol oxidase subunit II